MDIHAHRRRRLQELVDREAGGVAAEFARLHNQDAARIRQLLNPNYRKGHGFGEGAARRLEDDLRLPKLYFDLGIEREMASANHSSANTDISINSPISGMITETSPTNRDRIGKNDGEHVHESHRDAPRVGDNFTAGPDLRTRLYPEISWVQAGMWTEIAENFIATEETHQYPCHIDLGPDGYVLRVEGLSMTAPPGVFPSFPPGILLYVRPHEDAAPGKHVIVRRNGNTATFKKLTMVDGELFLEAINPDWPHRYIRVQADDVFCGVVMHAGFDL